MRIRKNAKILIEEKTSYLVCKLNRSPWDDDSFFSQLVEEGWDNCLPLNGSVANSNLISNSNLSGDSMKLSLKCKGEIEKVMEEKTALLWNEQVCDQHEPPLVEPPPPQPKKRGRPKKSTQAAAIVGSGCGGGGRNNNNSNSNNNNKSKSNNNPYSFYYYSGFGPSWSKKRDTNGNDNNKNNRNVTKRRKKSNYNVKKNYNDNGNDNDNDNRIQEEGNDKNNKSKNGGVETVYDEQLDYIDDDFDDDDNDDDGGIGVLYGGVRARPRKPIKARSLKSLM